MLTEKKGFQWTFLYTLVIWVQGIFYSLVLHEDVAEGAVEDGVDKVGEAEVEDEQVCHSLHPPVAWGQQEYHFVTRNVDRFWEVYKIRWEGILALKLNVSFYDGQTNTNSP